MKKIITIFSLYAILSLHGYTQTVFNKVYNPNNTTPRANTVIQTPDNGFLFAGYLNNGLKECALKTNNVGDTLWSFIYDLGTGGGDYITSAINTSDGNYVLGGTTADISQMNSNAFLIKLDNNGDTIWIKKYGLANRSERCYSVKQTADGGFALCGLRYNVDSTGSPTESDLYLVKIDSLGNEQWERTYGGFDTDVGNSLEITNEGGYMIFGYTYSFGIGLYNMYLVKTDSSGNFLWQKTYGGSLKDYGETVVKTTDGNFLIAGGTYITTDTVAGYIAKIDTAGLIIWEKKYRGQITHEEFSAVKQLQNGEIMVSGDEQGDSLNYRYYGILKKLDANGFAIWEKQYQYYGVDTTQHAFYAMDTCTDGGFVMAGITLDYRFGAINPISMWLVKTDCMGNDSIWDSVNCSLPVGVSEVVAKDINDVLVYPNPASNEIKIESKMQNAEIVIRDVLGQMVYSTKAIAASSTIDVSMLSKGVYFISLQNGKQTINKKVVKE